MEYIPVILTTVLVILTVIFCIVGVQFVMVLFEVRKTLRRVNLTIDMAESRVNQLLQPFQSFSGMATGLQAGFKVFEAFVGWLGRKDKER